MKKYIMAIIFGLFIALNPISSVNAQLIDDAGVLSNLEDTNDLYGYLNYYDYHLWKADHRYSMHDMYITSDETVIVDVWNDKLGHIYILKPGYATNKGIEIGMTYQDLINTYGDVSIIKNSGDYYKDYTGYVSADYESQSNEGLSFVINKYTQKIVLIRYQKNRHGNTLVMSDVIKHHLLPHLR